NSLSPAKVLLIKLFENRKTATVVVPDQQLSLAIGKEGQNARLAAKLTGWKVDIKSKTQYETDIEVKEKKKETLKEKEVIGEQKAEDREQKVDENNRIKDTE
ncbi:MAG: transcription termination/antitermination protein NusA, partial [Candidatus Caldatribacteriota bacterium]|nr:transcription termination/antitermination protein NusA [Candidatus Caldatribacteriota bacterium]